MNIEEQARVTAEATASCAARAVRFCEAYRGERSTVVVDGSMYSPSTRALPGASVAWQHADEDEWDLFERIVEKALDAWELAEDSDSEEPEMWTLSWDDGRLLASLPDLPDN